MKEQSPPLVSGQRTPLDPILVNERAEAGAHLTLSRRRVSRAEWGRAKLRRECLNILMVIHGRPPRSMGEMPSIMVESVSFPGTENGPQRQQGLKYYIGAPCLYKRVFEY